MSEDAVVLMAYLVTYGLIGGYTGWLYLRHRRLIGRK
jgi:hypothetical protein